MTHFAKLSAALGIVTVVSVLAPRTARADEASVTVGGRFSEPPPRATNAPIATEPGDEERPEPPELRRSPVRLMLGPVGITTGKGFGAGVGVAADFGTGSVGARLAAAWLRGEGHASDGSITPTGDAVGHYGGELTLDLHKRGPLHPIIGMGVGLVHVSRPDTSGFAGVGTGRFALEYSLALEDADVRLGGSVTGGLVGPVDSDVNDFRAYALAGVHLAIGF